MQYHKSEPFFFSSVMHYYPVLCFCLLLVKDGTFQFMPRNLLQFDVKVSMAAKIYDATYILAEALDEVIKANGSVYDGEAVFKHMVNRSYKSKLYVAGYDWQAFDFIFYLFISISNVNVYRKIN